MKHHHSSVVVLALLLLSWGSFSQGAPTSPQRLVEGHELHLWREIDDLCSSFFSDNRQQQPSTTFEELCYMAWITLQQDSEDKGESKRFLFHYSKTHDSGNSDFMDEYQGLGLIPSRGYFLFRDPNEDTEWNDVLRSFGIIPPKEQPRDEVEEMVLRLQEEAKVKPYERMNLAELKEAEDEFDEEDERAIEMYRCQRMADWQAVQRKSRFGELAELQGDEYVKQITYAGEDIWVILHLYRPGIPMCILLNHHLGQLAKKYPEAKFMKAIANICIPNYPDKYLPTIFVYFEGAMKARFIGVECGTPDMKLEELEWKLTNTGAIKADLEENPKKNTVDMMASSIKDCSIKSSNESDDEEA